MSKMEPKWAQMVRNYQAVLTRHLPDKTSELVLTKRLPDKTSDMVLTKRLPDKTSILTKVCWPKLRDVEDKMITEWVEDQPPGIFSAPGVGQFLVASCQLRQLNGRPQLSGRPKMFLYDHQYSLMCLHWFILAYWSRHIPWSNRQLCQREIHQLLQQKTQHCSLPARSKRASPRPACPRPCAPLIEFLSWLSLRRPTRPWSTHHGHDG